MTAFSIKLSSKALNLRLAFLTWKNRDKKLLAKASVRVRQSVTSEIPAGPLAASSV